MGPVDQNASLARLARAVSGRRQYLGSSQDAVTDRGGPSDRTLREIENATATTFTTATLRKLDQGLLWDIGTARAVLENTMSPEEAVAARQVAHTAQPGAVAGEARGVWADSDPLAAQPHHSTSYSVGRPSRQLQRAAARRGARRYHDAAESRALSSSETRSTDSQFRASQPLAEALAALQDIDDPNSSEAHAIDLVWQALREVMEQPDRPPRVSPSETTSRRSSVSAGSPVDKVDKAWESKGINEIAEAPLEALQGVSDGDARHLRDAFNIKTVRDLGTNKYFLWAQSIAKLAE